MSASKQQLAAAQVTASRAQQTASPTAGHATATCFDHQTQQAVGVKDKVGGGGGAVADYGVHAADLEVAGDDLQVVEDSPQVVLLQLQHSRQECDLSMCGGLGLLRSNACAWAVLQVQIPTLLCHLHLDVLRDEADGHLVRLLPAHQCQISCSGSAALAAWATLAARLAICCCSPGPGDDDVCVLAAGRDVGVERRLDEFGVLLDDARHVAAPVHDVPLYPAAVKLASMSSDSSPLRIRIRKKHLPRTTTQGAHRGEHTLRKIPLPMI